MQNIKLILFDIGGVFINFEDHFKTAAREQQIDINYLHDTFRKYHLEVTTGIISPQELYINCIIENNLDANLNYNFLASWVNDYKANTSTASLVIKLSKKYNIGLLSNLYLEMVPLLLQKKLIPNIKYKYKFISCDINLQKPDKDIFEYVIKKTMLAPNEIMFIDDKEKNTNMAKGYGFRTFDFQRKNPEKSVSELARILL